MEFRNDVFSVTSESEFLRTSLELFHFQYEYNQVYKAFVDSLNLDPLNIKSLVQIPFLPVEFFKNKEVMCGKQPPQKIFHSSGTSGPEKSRHYISDLNLYRKSLQLGFEFFFGPVEDCQFLALTPTPEQHPNSSLVFMLSRLMDLSLSAENGFFLQSFSGLHARLKQSHPQGKKVILFGLTHALLNFARQFPDNYGQVIVVETGGMKGQGEEMIREELHATLCSSFGLKKIHSEYSMTELLSQAYSQGDGVFHCPPWMKVLIRETKDPFSFEKPGTTGGINIIDLANIYSCAFISTQDLGRKYTDGSFEVLGRFDSADARGCSLMI